MNLKFLVQCLVRMDYAGLFQTVSKVHKACGKNRMAVMADVVKCGLRYGAGYNDYLLCQFYNLTEEQRATYITRQVNNKLVAMLNDREYYHLFDNKKDFYSTFSDCLGRDWLDFTKASEEDFTRFLQGREEIMVKPDAESGGKGVEKLRVGDYPSPQALYRKLQGDNIGVVEDVIVQNQEMARLNPSCLNTLRIVTILNGQGPHIVYAFVRIGNSDRPVDNLHSGGMFAPIDLDTGKISAPGYDKNQRTFETHPLTGVKLVGFQIPYWEESKALCLKAATRVHRLGRGPDGPGASLRGGEQPAGLRHPADAAPYPGQDWHAAHLPQVRGRHLNRTRKESFPGGGSLFLPRERKSPRFAGGLGLSCCPSARCGGTAGAGGA